MDSPMISAIDAFAHDLERADTAESVLALLDKGYPNDLSPRISSHQLLSRYPLVGSISPTDWASLNSSADEDPAVRAFLALFELIYTQVKTHDLIQYLLKQAALRSDENVINERVQKGILYESPNVGTSVSQALLDRTLSSGSADLINRAALDYMKHPSRLLEDRLVVFHNDFSYPDGPVRDMAIRLNATFLKTFGVEIPLPHIHMAACLAQSGSPYEGIVSIDGRADHFAQLLKRLLPRKPHVQVHLTTGNQWKNLHSSKPVLLLASTQNTFQRAASEPYMPFHPVRFCVLNGPVGKAVNRHTPLHPFQVILQSKPAPMPFMTALSQATEVLGGTKKVRLGRASS